MVQRHDIRRPAQPVFQPRSHLQVDQGVFFPRGPIQVDRHIDIASVTASARRDGPEDVQLTHGGKMAHEVGDGIHHGIKHGVRARGHVEHAVHFSNSLTIGLRHKSLALP